MRIFLAVTQLKRQWGQLVCLLLFLSVDLPAYGNTLKYDPSASGNWYPYYNPDNQQMPGIFAEVIPLIMQKAGIEISKVSLPPRRTVKALHNGDLDFEIVSSEWFADKTLGPGFVGSVPILPVTEYFVSLPEFAQHSRSLDNIYGGLVGTIGGYYYFDDNKFKRMDMPSENEVVLGLAKQRYKVAILEHATAIYWSEKNQVPLVFGAVHSKGELKLRFRQEHAHLLPRINRAIEDLSLSGTIEKIRRKYLSTVWAG